MAHEPIVAQKLAQESGYHSYSTFLLRATVLQLENKG